jgi:hypothetical protein
MIAAADPVAFRRYQAADYDSVASLWTRVNRELAPIGMQKLFEQYIARKSPLTARSVGRSMEKISERSGVTSGCRHP